MPTFVLHTLKGKVQNFEEARRFFVGLKDGLHVITAKHQGQRSLPQNAYFHAVVCPLLVDPLRELGWEHIHDPEDAKDFVKKLFLTRRVANHETGEMHEYVLHTSKLTTLEFKEFVEQIQQWAAEELNIYIPDPNQYLKP